jgi:hypothetical protein
MSEIQNNATRKERDMTPRKQAMTGTMTMCGVLFGTTWLLVGCSQPASTPAPAAKAPVVKIDGAKFVLTEEPADAKTVDEVREAAQDGDEVVIVGRIGGDLDPWVADRAAFLIVDPARIPCSERKSDTCKTPWDYCCETDLAKSKATIKFVDEAGKTLANDARQLLNVKELQTVVVKGQAKRDEAGNLTVLASGLFVRPDNDVKAE